MNLINEIHNYLSEELEAVNAMILDNISAEEELIQLISNHLTTSGGKRIRPILTILSAKMFGCSKKNVIKLAAAIEFIHMATLLHDDVVDGSKMRRFVPSANVIWGAKASILVGDFLFSQSFKLIVSTQLMPALTVLSNASAVIAEGEVSQLSQLERKSITSEKEYFRIINAKTAELFSAACAVGAIVAKRDDCVNPLKHFGLYLGNIFQISDDILDYFSNSKKVGKNIGDDFFEGKVTLPLILLSKKIDTENLEELQRILKSATRSADDFTWIKDLMHKHEIKNDIADYLQKSKDSAINWIDKINVEHKCKNYLKQLLNFAIERTY